MDRRIVFQKTGKGQHEVATRSHRLPARERSLLIMVDGKMSGEQLIAQARHFGDAEQFLDNLLRNGFIAPVGGSEEAAPPEAAAQPQPVSAAADPMAAFMATKAFVTRYFIDLLGPDADPLTMKIESARTEGQLLLLMEKCREIVRELKGDDAAERFWNQGRSRLGGEP